MRDRKGLAVGLLAGLLAVCFIVSVSTGPLSFRRLESEEDALSTDQKAAQDLSDFKIEWTPFTIFTFFCIGLSLIVASASGIGGGGILVRDNLPNLAPTVRNAAADCGFPHFG